MIEKLLLSFALMVSIEFIVVGVIIHLRYPNTLHKKTLFIVAISFAVITMCMNPTKYWDIYRQYESLDAIRTSEIGLVDFLFDNKLRIGGSDYKSLFAYNLIRYFVVSLGNNRLLPFIMTAITYAIWSYITIDWVKERPITGNDIIISMMLSGVLMPFIFVNSGLRNTTAAAIAALAIYNNLYKKHRIVELLLLFIVAFTIHYSMVYVIVVYLLTKLCQKKIAVVVLFAWTNVIPLIANQFKNSQYEVLRKMASSFAIYTGRRGFSINYYLSGVYIVMFALGIALLLTHKKSNGTANIKDFIVMMVINAIFNFGYSEIVLRPLYTLGVMSTPVLYYMCGENLRENKPLQIMSILCIILGSVLVLRISLPEYLVISYC